MYICTHQYPQLNSVISYIFISVIFLYFDLLWWYWNIQNCGTSGILLFCSTCRILLFSYISGITLQQQKLNKGAVAGFLPTTESNLRTPLGVKIYKFGIITRICKPPPEKLFSDLCSEMGICSDVMWKVYKYKRSVDAQFEIWFWSEKTYFNFEALV